MSKHNTGTSSEDGLILSGYSKKLKTMKKKYFALYKETLSNVARLEYYDNEKKYKAGLTPKRIIKLKHCFNINRRFDTKYDNVIALSTKDGGFGIVYENEDEMLKWLEALISLQRCGISMSDSPTHPQFEHVWQVSIQKKGLAEEKGIVGSYHICLTYKSVTFIRIGPDTISGSPRIAQIEFLLTTIRRVGDSQCFFYMEVGRQSTIGPGELWMETEDTLIAQNMHHMILSAMSAKGDPNVEPMRKRSSSANEASKPTHILQKRQTQLECKVNNSPKTNFYFGRERCDSLPSRNRNSHEGSNQSIITIRNSAISALRPTSYQRHSNSPPASSNIACSESEESSISIDEPDDNGCFPSYRFNSRSSEGVIPEENTDELLVTFENKTNELSNKADADSACQPSEISDHRQESYVSMAPLNNLIELNVRNSLWDSAGNSTNQGGSNSNIEFPEYTLDAYKSFMNEVDLESDRPLRTYSIGSKAEHNQISKRIGNLNEADQRIIRVRAFSVGSRAKIPRCELQREVLFPKSNFNGNNDISSMDVTAYNQLLNINVCRNKKSTSAPLLIHKSHHSVDRMSDLMEIDFSQSPNKTNQINSFAKTQFSRSAPNTTRDQIKKLDKLKISASYEESSAKAADLKPVTTTDNGYLEMKPLGNSANKRLTTRTGIASSTFSEPKICGPSKIVPDSKKPLLNLSPPEVLVSKQNECKNSSPSKNLSFTDNTDSLNTFQSLKSEANFQDPINRKNLSECKFDGTDLLNDNSFDLPSKCAHLTLRVASKKETDNDNDDYVNIGKVCNDVVKSKAKTKKSAHFDIGKLIHSQSDDKCVLNNPEKKPVPCEETGYEILQIKSDSSLQSHKLFNRPTSIRKEKQEHHLVQVRPRSTNSATVKASTFTSTLRGCTSSSTSCLNYLPLSHTQSTAREFNNSTYNNSRLNNTSHAKPQPNAVTSRPPSVGSEHELYYASLDLPQSNFESNAKAPKMEVLVEPIPIVSSINNSYAKIDFDHSDSSSSSSKHFDM